MSGLEYRIRPQKGISINLKELWFYKELFYFFTWRDIKVKYKQTVLGFLWAILQPFILMLIFTLFFGRALNVPSDNIPYPIFVYSGLMFWNLFATGLLGAGNSMVTNSNIIKKIYFPRLIIPISSILVALFDFIMAFIVFIGLLVYYQFPINIFKLLFVLPISLIIALLGTLGVGSLIAALNVKYRDFRYILTFLVQILLFLTPVIYPSSIVTTPWQKYILAINPMSGSINLFRSLVIGKPLEIDLFIVSVISTLVLFLIGLLYFRKTESYFADIA